MVFQTHYTHKSDPPEVNSGISPVEKNGYISAQKRIENLILAGQRLIESRKQQFDFIGNEIDEDFYDPTRDPNFDMADASQIALSVDTRLKAQKAAASVPEVKTEASQTAPDKSGAV